MKWFDYYKSHCQNARLTCRHFDISPETFYRWKRRYKPYHLESLEDRPKRPKHLRQPTASAELVAVVQRLREKYPRWGKDKLAVLVGEEGYEVSTSMVGRIIRRLWAATLRLRALEVPKPVGGTFRNREMVHGILTDPAYAGKPYCFTLP